MAKNTAKNAMESNVRARNNYIKNRTRRVSVSFNIVTEADMLAHLKKQKNMATYIKSLIAKDMK